MLFMSATQPDIQVATSMAERLFTVPVMSIEDGIEGITIQELQLGALPYVIILTRVTGALPLDEEAIMEAGGWDIDMPT